MNALADNPRNDGYGILTIDNIANYLLDRKLLDIESIVDGDLRILDASRKNRNIKVIRERGTSFFVKQPNRGDAVSAAAIQREALLYLLIQSDPEFGSLSGLTPRVIDFDAQRTVLITELIRGQTWNEFIYQASRGNIRGEYAAVLGKSIAALHKVFDGATGSKKLSFLPTALLPFTAISRPGPEIFATISAANLQLLKIIQQYSSLHDSLDQLSSEWDPQTVIHGDIKWDNVLVSSGKEGGHDSIRTTITDWETVNLGDPAWDVGGIFQEFIRFWLSLLPVTGAESAAQLVASATYPITNIQPAIRAFWQGYCRVVANDPKRSNELLVRSAKFCAARLVQTAYESLYLSTELSNLAVYMVQIALNIFSNTDDAVIRLLGVPFRGDIM